MRRPRNVHRADAKIQASAAAASTRLTMSSHYNERVKQHLQRVQESLPVALGRRFIETNLLTHAASLSFYALLSMAPLLILLLWITASLYPSAQHALLQQIGALAGPDAGKVADTVIANATQQPDVGSLAGLWSTLLLFLGATAVFAQLQAALNLIFRTETERLVSIAGWIRKRVFSFGVVFALGFLLLVSMTLTTALQLWFANVPSILPTLGSLVAWAIYSVAFAFLYHYLPDRRVRWKQALLGGAITAALFAGGRYLIGLYLAEAAPGSAYGSMGTLVLLLVWMYYAAAVFFIGALITAVIDERSLRTRAPAQQDAVAEDAAE
jgi:membrane protein